MTEVEWLGCNDLPTMLEFLRDQASDRKLLLFAVACCRRIWPVLHPNHSQRLVELTERMVDGQCSSSELRSASVNARQFADSDEDRLTEISCSAAYAAASISEKYPGERTAWIATRVADCVCNTFYWIAYEAEASRGSTDERASLAGNAGESSEQAVQIAFLRDIIGNPFTPVAAFHPAVLAWQEGTILKQAQAIYHERAFDCLPILADLLEQAGCNDSDILDRCREQLPHVRGCRVVDLALGKT